MGKGTARAAGIALGAAITINGIVIAIFANSTIGAWLTMALGLVILLPCVFSRGFARLLKRLWVRIVSVIVAVGCAAMLAASACLYIYGNLPTVTYDEDCLVVLGCGVQNGEPTAALAARLDTALLYLEKNEDCKIAVTGGQGPDEDIPEAEAMARYLTDRGVAAERIVKEDKSSSTTENFRFTDALIDGGISDAAFVTSDFHIFRAASLARRQGLTPTHLGAPTPWYNILPCYLREFLAIGQMYILNK